MCYLVTKVLGNFPEIFLLLISNLISPWSENILCMTCIPLNVLMLALWPRIRSSQYMSHVVLKRMCILPLLGIAAFYVTCIKLADSFCSSLLYPQFRFFFLLSRSLKLSLCIIQLQNLSSCSNIERSFQISNYNYRFVNFSLQFYQFLLQEF